MSKLSKLQISILEKSKRLEWLKEQLRISKKRFKNNRRTLTQIFALKLRYKQLAPATGWWVLARFLEKKKAKKYAPIRALMGDMLRRFPEHKLGKFMEEAPGMYLLMEALNHRTHWKRPLETWRPQSRKGEKMALELIHHLFALYPVPAFMNKAWLNRDLTQIRWFIHIGAGGNLRKAPRLPLVISKKMAHYCLQGPSYLSVEQAIRRGQILGLGGNKKLIRQILQSRIGKQLENEGFWLGLIQFLVNHQEEEKIPVDKIVDYVHLQKFGLPAEEPTYIYPELAAENPAFQMKGRSLPSLKKIVEARFSQDGRLKIKFPSIPIAAFQWQDSQTTNPRIIRIQRIEHNTELIREGQAMKHCVATYNQYCLDGSTSIWSLTTETPEKEAKRRLTIEVRHGDEQPEVYQIRGKCNRGPKEEEIKWIRLWAEENQLLLSNYLNN